MTEILDELSRTCNLRGVGGRTLEISRSLDSPAVKAVGRLEGILGAREADILIAACAALLFRYTDLSNMTLWSLTVDATPASSCRRCWRCHRIGVSALTSFRGLVGDLGASEVSGESPSPSIPVVSHAVDRDDSGDGMPFSHGAARADLRIDFLSSLQAIRLRLTYREGRLAEALAHRFSAHLSRFLESLAARPELGIGDHDYMSTTELRQIIDRGRGPHRDYVVMPVTELIARRAERQADVRALEDEQSQLSYGELMVRSEQVARGLLAKGLLAGGHVGVLLDRSTSWIVTILGIMRAGMVYVPLSTHNPSTRNEYIMSDCSVSLVISDAANRHHLPRRSDLITDLADLPALARSHRAALSALDPHDDAYVIYTSGSTGLPKGVRITHAALCNYILAAKDAFWPDMETPRTVQFSEASFDASMLEIFFGICHGGSSFIYSRPEALPMADFVAKLEDHDINLVSLPTTFWHEWMSQIAAGRSRMPDCVKVAVIGGEAAIPEHFCKANLSPEFRLFNAYGPTETTVDAAAYRCGADVQGRRYVPIGHPLPNVRLYVLDDRLIPVAAAVVGELCIGGAGVSPGYVGCGNLNAERFVTFSVPGVFQGERIYRTGDLAFFQEDGTLVVLGRRDSQIKISGMRVDLSEIEMRLNACDPVIQAVVTWDREAPQEGALTMHLRLREDIPRTDETCRRIVDDLRQYVPDHMVPRRHTFIDAFPVNTNGKIERRRLPAGSRSAVSVSAPPLPRNATERKLWDLWVRTIPREPLTSIHDDIFLKQVSSLKLGLFFAEIAIAWDVDIDIASIAETRTLSAIAGHLDALLAKSV